MDRSDLKKAVLETAAEMQQHPQMLAFSCGADSLASLIRMRAWGLDPKLVYFYFIPDLVLVETYLAYIERIFDTQIMRLPHKLWTQFMANGLLQKPGVGKRMYEHTDLGTPSSSLLNTWALSTLGDNARIAIGLRVTDGIFRAQKLRKEGPVHGVEWYPVADCGRLEIRDIIMQAGLKLPYDYRLFGRSFESIRASVAPQIRAHCPETWAQICEWFPMAPLLCHQQPGRRYRDQENRMATYAALAFESEKNT